MGAVPGEISSRHAKERSVRSRRRGLSDTRVSERQGEEDMGCGGSWTGLDLDLDLDCIGVD